MPLLFFAAIVGAQDHAVLKIEALSGAGWKLEGISVALSQAFSKQRQLVMTITKLTLPKPFAELQLADIRCRSFSWSDSEIRCNQGSAKISSRLWHMPVADFSFRWSQKQGDAELSGHLLEGAFTAQIVKQGKAWQINLKSERLAVNRLMNALGIKDSSIQQGWVDLDFEVIGYGSAITDANASVRLAHLDLQSADGKLATEKLSTDLQIELVRKDALWQWRINQQMTGGAFYRDPVYLEADHSNIQLTATGNWESADKQLAVDGLTVTHANVGTLKASGHFDLFPSIQLADAEATLETKNLSRFAPIYLQPFTPETLLEGLTLDGNLKAGLSYRNQQLKQLEIDFKDLAVHDSTSRIAAEGGYGAIRWNPEFADPLPSKFGWEKLSLYKLPFGPGKLDLLLQAQRIKLIAATELPFLGGHIALNRFSWQKEPGMEPSLYFNGGVESASLEQMTNALGWTPLNGTLSGNIPGVAYRNKILELNGVLTATVFGGNVTVDRLSVSGLLGDLPQLSANIELERLDLDQITRKFEFGGITGRVSGFIRNLQLENWRPVEFFAWFGTPDDDDSKHRISQKAVRNITRLGGGGASDFVSRGFLRFFENFGYRRLGIGCYLHAGVCQMMGVEATGQGYSIIQGGGLPRIDVIGYNPRVDWNILVDRLRRLTEPENAIVE